MPLAARSRMLAPVPPLAAALSLAAASGCFEPVYEACRVACTSDEDCAPGHACGAAGLCAPAAEPRACDEPPPAAPASPAGMYDLVLTDQENGCKLGGWKVGFSSNVTVELREVGSTVTAAPRGTMASILEGWLGTSAFEGTYDDPRLVLVLEGTRFTSNWGCVYTFDVTIDAALDGDLLDGGLSYRARTNGAASCDELNDCTSRRELHGMRSPSLSPGDG